MRYQTLTILKEETPEENSQTRGKKMRENKAYNSLKLKILFQTDKIFVLMFIHFFSSSYTFNGRYSQKKKYILVFTGCTKSVLKQNYYEVREGINEALQESKTNSKQNEKKLMISSKEEEKAGRKGTLI